MGASLHARSSGRRHGVRTTDESLEGCESGRIGTLGKRVKGNLPWVRIPLPPPCRCHSPTTRSRQHHEAMQRALDEARAALDHDDVPVGAVVVHRGHGHRRPPQRARAATRSGRSRRSAGDAGRRRTVSASGGSTSARCTSRSNRARCARERWSTPGSDTSSTRRPTRRRARRAACTNSSTATA